MSQIEVPGGKVFCGGKVAEEHLLRGVAIYIRQSTPQQVAANRESLERQYALRDRAAALGWRASAVCIIDDDLGQSGRSSEKRVGFQRLMADVAQNRIGLVLAIEMSRLARNSRDWHDLFDLCAVRGTLLGDEDGVYDPLDINDRLVLGLKGIMSEMELHLIRARMQRGRENKAARGELYDHIPTGYVPSRDGRLEFDPDEQVRAAIRLVFDKFHELRSAYALLRYLRRHGLHLPERRRDGTLHWHKATQCRLGTMLHQPIYAGAYAWGRKCMGTVIDLHGNVRRSRKRLQPIESWKVLLRDHHPHFITWPEFEENQEILRQNRRSPTTRGQAGGGMALAAGLVYCGRCGRKMQVEYISRNRARYSCTSRPLTVDNEPACGGLPAHVVDVLIQRQVFTVLEPARIELSLGAVEHARVERQRLREQLCYQVERATQETHRAERQYQQVEPENRLVARTLEQRWEDALGKRQQLSDQLLRFDQQTSCELTIDERAAIERLSSDIPALWNSSTTTPEDHKQIVACLVERIEVIVQPRAVADVVVYWSGGFQSHHELPRPVDYAAHPQDQLLVARIAELRRSGSRSPEIAKQLNAEGFRMARTGRPLSSGMVQKLMVRPEVCSQLGRSPQRKDQWPLEQLAERLGVQAKKLQDWARRGWLQVIQRPFGGQWIIAAQDAEIKRLEELVRLSVPGRTRYPPDMLTPRND